MKTAILISTYNWKEALNLVFKSILMQTKMPDEILIADDGSDENTRQLIRDFSKKIKVPVKHVWQEDIGFRKAMILNKTIAQSTSDYIIQIDGDCIVHNCFIQDHINNCKKQQYLYGSRVNILAEHLPKLFQNKIILFNFFSKEIKNRTRTLHFPLISKFYKAHKKISNKFRGCNVSYWYSDFLAVNGYNEDFEGWGREDSDLAIRMGNLGVKAKRLRYAAILYHIYHKTNLKHNFELNDSIQEKTINEKIIRCKKGVDQYLFESKSN
jgi:glycosyltransferase involved in cell wall biosynthesis